MFFKVVFFNIFILEKKKRKGGKEGVGEERERKDRRKGGRYKEEKERESEREGGREGGKNGRERW